MRTFATLLIAVLLSGCEQQHPTATDTEASGEATPVAGDIEDAQRNQQIVAAIKAGNYQQAIQLSREARVTKPEADLAIGQLILQGLSDAQARQRPNESVATALELIEASATAAHEQAIYALAALFYTGLQAGESGAFLVPADQDLHACWEAAKQQRETISSCVAMRGNR